MWVNRRETARQMREAKTQPPLGQDGTARKIPSHVTVGRLYGSFPQQGCIRSLGMIDKGMLHARGIGGNALPGMDQHRHIGAATIDQQFMQYLVVEPCLFLGNDHLLLHRAIGTAVTMVLNRREPGARVHLDPDKSLVLDAILDQIQT